MAAMSTITNTDENDTKEKNDRTTSVQRQSDKSAGKDSLDLDSSCMQEPETCLAASGLDQVLAGAPTSHSKSFEKMKNITSGSSTVSDSAQTPALIAGPLSKKQKLSNAQFVMMDIKTEPPDEWPDSAEPILAPEFVPVEQDHIKTEPEDVESVYLPPVEQIEMPPMHCLAPSLPSDTNVMPMWVIPSSAAKTLSATLAKRACKLANTEDRMIKKTCVMIEDKEHSKKDYAMKCKDGKRDYCCQVETQRFSKNTWQQTSMNVSQGVDTAMATRCVRNKHMCVQSELIRSKDIEYVVATKLEQASTQEARLQDDTQQERSESKTSGENHRESEETHGESSDGESEKLSAQCLHMTRVLHDRQLCRYLGLTKDNKWVIPCLCKDLTQHLGVECAGIQAQDVVELILRKERLNESFVILGDCFGISESQATAVYQKHGTMVLGLLESIGLRVGLLYNGNGFFFQ